MSTLKPTTDLDRTMAAFRLLVESVYPAAVYWICHEYSVVESDGETFSGTPTDATFSPALPTRVPYAPSLAGSFTVVPQGTIAHVVFVNADPSKPRCVGFDLPTLPTSTTIDATGTIAVGPNASEVVLTDATSVATSPATAASERRIMCYGDIISVGVASGPATLAGGTCSKSRA